MKKIKEILKNLWSSFCRHKKWTWITRDLDYGRGFEGTKICNRCNKVIRKFNASSKVLMKLHERHPEMNKEGVMISDIDIIAGWVDKIKQEEL